MAGRRRPQNDRMFAGSHLDSMGREVSGGGLKFSARNADQSCGFLIVARRPLCPLRLSVACSPRCSNSRRISSNWARTCSPGMDKATTSNFETALQTPGADVVFSGHANENPQTGATEGIQLGPADDMGNAHAVGDVATTTGPDGLPETAVTDELNASSVALFGCSTTILGSDFAGTTFTGTQPTTNTEAQDAGARAYTDTLVRNGTLDQATTAASKAMISTTSKANASLPPEKNKFETPSVCTTGPGGQPQCKPK